MLNKLHERNRESIKLRFCDFFTEYKTELKKLDKKSWVRFEKQTVQDKICLVILFIIGVIVFIGPIVALKMHYKVPNLIYGALLIIIFICYKIGDRQSNIKYRLDNINKPYSEKRMNMIIGLLKKYRINIQNSDVIYLLIEEAKEEQRKGDFFRDLKKISIKLSAAVVTIWSFGQTVSWSKNFTEGQILQIKIYFIFFIIAAILIFHAFFPVIRSFFDPDFYKYDKLINDLKQILIFYSEDHKKVIQI